MWIFLILLACTSFGRGAVKLIFGVLLIIVGAAMLS